MKYLFIYYTGTYNTRFLTEKIRENLLTADDEYDIIEINADTQPVDTLKYDIIGLGYPIYAFNSPLPFNNYLKKLSFNPGQRYFIYENSGEPMGMNNAASRIPKKIMRKSQGICIGEYHFLMPYNIMFPFDDGLLHSVIQRDKKLLEIMRYDFERGIVRSVSDNLFYDAAAFVMSVQKVGGGFNTLFYSVDTDKCVLCNKCAKNCPEHNISIVDGRIVFGRNCDMCMRCSFFCPKQAISIGMLENWRVSNYFDLPSLWGETEICKEYQISENTRFYKYFQSYFKETDELYEKIFRTENSISEY